VSRFCLCPFNNTFLLLFRHRMMTDHEVTLINDSMMEFYVSFKGPKDSMYKSCARFWQVAFELFLLARHRIHFSLSPCTWTLQVRMRAAYGKCAASYLRPIHTRARPSGSSTKSFTQILTKRMSFPHEKRTAGRALPCLLWLLLPLSL
jgi:hypothetical protein